MGQGSMAHCARPALVEYLELKLGCLVGHVTSFNRATLAGWLELVEACFGVPGVHSTGLPLMRQRFSRHKLWGFLGHAVLSEPYLGGTAEAEMDTGWWCHSPGPHWCGPSRRARVPDPAPTHAIKVEGEGKNNPCQHL